MEKERVARWLRENWLLVLILLVGVAIRVYEFGEVPSGLNQDEVISGYDAWATYKFGSDSNGLHNPVIFVGCGPGQNSLHQYLSIPFIAVFGLNAFGIRFVDLLFGIIALIVFYLLVREISDKQTALIAVFLLAICPWHIMLSRWGMDENLFPEFFLIGTYFLVRSLKKEYNLPISFLFFALSLYSHNSAYFVVPLFVLLSSIYLIAHKKVRLKIFLLSIIVFAIAGLPVFLYLVINIFGLNPVETPFFSIPRATVPRFLRSTLFSDNILGAIPGNFKGLISLIIRQNDGLLFNQMPPYGFLYQLSIPFFALGFLVLLARNSKIKAFEKSFFVLLWLLLSFALGLLMQVFGNRLNILFFPMIFVTAAGIMHVKDRISPYLFYLAIILYVLLFASFSYTYFTEYPELAEPVFFDGFGDAIKYALNLTTGPVCITVYPPLSYIHVLFFMQMPPNSFIKTKEYFNKGDEVQYVKKFDRYYFGAEGCKLTASPEAYIFHEKEAKPFTTDKFDIKWFKRYGVVIRHYFPQNTKNETFIY